MKGVIFEDLSGVKTHSYKDLNLILAPFEMPPASPKTNYIDVEGADGSLDFTECHGEVKFNDREGSMTFSVLPSDDWEKKKSEVSNLLNGLRCKITLDKDPEYYYSGRCKVSEHKSDKMLRQIVIDFRVAPYKLKQNVTEITVSAGTHKLNNRRMSVVPVITTTADATLHFNGNTFNLSAGGSATFLDIQFKQGKNEITVETTGTVTFRYQEGGL